MKYRYDGYNWLVRLEKDELLVENLTKLVREEGITAGWISGLGGALWAELGFYQLETKEYKWQKFDKLLEITSLQGNIARHDSEPTLHIHGAFSDENYQAIGGHVKELKVGGTCEIFIHAWHKDAPNRLQDPTVGLKLLDL